MYRHRANVPQRVILDPSAHSRNIRASWHAYTINNEHLIQAMLHVPYTQCKIQVIESRA